MSPKKVRKSRIDAANKPEQEVDQREDGQRAVVAAAALVDVDSVLLRLEPSSPS